MPAPAVVGVYVAAAVGTAVAGYVFKEFVYDPYIAPKILQWREELRLRRQARAWKLHKPLPSAPNCFHEDLQQHSLEDLRRRGGHEPGSVVELTQLNPIGKSSSTQSSVSSADVRQRRGQQSPLSQVRVLDTSNADISFPTLTPIPASPPKSEDSVCERSGKVNRFAVGSETTTAASSPRERTLSVLDSPVGSPRIQLPTPPSESAEYGRASAPSMSQTQSGSSASFVTAVSPRTEFHSLSPSRANSPTSGTMSLSITSSMAGDEEMFSAGSRSRESLVLVHVTESHEDLSDRFSEVSWEDVEGRSSGAVSPRC